MPRIFDREPFVVLNLRHGTKYWSTWDVFECDECGQTDFLNSEDEHSEEPECTCGGRMYIEMEPMLERLVPLY